MESEIFYYIETTFADCPECNESIVASPTRLLFLLPWLSVYESSIDAGTFQLYLMVDLMTMTIKPE